MDKYSDIQNICNQKVSELLTNFFAQKLLLKMFGVYDEFGNLLAEPVIYGEVDMDYVENLEYYNKLSRSILFPDFYIDEEIRELTLLRNDILGITIAIIHIDDESKLEFIGEKTIGDLVKKYPSLIRSMSMGTMDMIT